MSYTTNASGEVLGLYYKTQESPLNYMDEHSERVGDKLILGYLSDEVMPLNPLEDWAGMGSITDTHQSEALEALALTPSGDRDLRRAYEYPETIRPVWVISASQNEEFRKFCQGRGLKPESEDDDEQSKFYLSQAAEAWVDPTIDAFAFDFTDIVLEEVFDELRGQGVIGDPDAVLLDVYEHSGKSYSVSGEGMSCPWDTSRGGAIWRPDDVASTEIERRAKVYAFGKMSETTESCRAYFTFVFDNGVEIGPYEVWHEAFLATQEAVGERTSDAKSLKQGRERAAIEVARGAAEVYTDFVNGCIYVVNVEVHRALTESDDPTETDLEDAFNEDQLFGQQVAESELQKEFNRIVKEEKDSLAAKVRH